MDLAVFGGVIAVGLHMYAPVLVDNLAIAMIMTYTRIYKSISILSDTTNH